MGYDSVRFLIEAIKTRNGDTADKDALVAALEKTSFASPRGPVRIAPGTRSVMQNVYITRTVMRDGQTGFEILETVPNVPDAAEGCVLR